VLPGDKLREGSLNFSTLLKKHSLSAAPISIETLWLNITRLCNQSCSHCHVDASPDRAEHMPQKVMERCLELLAGCESCHNLDITGGAPELHPDFDYLVLEARKLGKQVKVRHNLTVILDGNPRTGENKGYLPEFFAENRVEIIASLPHYNEAVADKQRGAGVFKKSITALRLLNAMGYGQPGSGLVVNLVHNCDGPLLSARRSELESEFKKELTEKYGVIFNHLLGVTNMPINRFRSRLTESGKYNSYMESLVNAFSPEAVGRLVCRSLISVGYDGRVYDCDFNQMLGLQVSDDKPMTVFNADLNALLNREIVFASHCFGCTAGGGSS
jgi:radical SAM/Cys-rich protein